MSFKSDFNFRVSAALRSIRSTLRVFSQQDIQLTLPTKPYPEGIILTCDFLMLTTGYKPTSPYFKTIPVIVKEDWEEYDDVVRENFNYVLKLLALRYPQLWEKLIIVTKENRIKIDKYFTTVLISDLRKAVITKQKRINNEEVISWRWSRMKVDS